MPPKTRARCTEGNARSRIFRPVHQSAPSFKAVRLARQAATKPNGYVIKIRTAAQLISVKLFGASKANASTKSDRSGHGTTRSASKNSKTFAINFIYQLLARADPEPL